MVMIGGRFDILSEVRRLKCRRISRSLNVDEGFKYLECKLIDALTIAVTIGQYPLVFTRKYCSKDKKSPPRSLMEFIFIFKDHN